MSKLEERAQSIQKSSDFKSWEHDDMSELFWFCLGRYIKKPTERDLQLMRMAYLWAVHANRGLANSFFHALRWAGINYYEELEKWRKSKG